MEDLVESILDYVRSDYTDYAIMINGEWGVGKTHFWNNKIKKKIESMQLNGKRYNTIYMSLYGISNLEEISKHLGSSFGAILGNQPSPKMFSNLLFTRLRELENAPFVLVEGESKKIGCVVLPSILYESYQSAPKILIQTPLEKRIERILKQYGKITPMFFETAMQKIAPFMQKSYWQEAKDSFYYGDLRRVAEILLVEYYDKVYKKESYDCMISYHTIPQVIAEIMDFARKYY